MAENIFLGIMLFVFLVCPLLYSGYLYLSIQTPKQRIMTMLKFTAVVLVIVLIIWAFVFGCRVSPSFRNIIKMIFAVFGIGLMTVFVIGNLASLFGFHKITTVCVGISMIGVFLLIPIGIMFFIAMFA